MGWKDGEYRQRDSFNYIKRCRNISKFGVFFDLDDRLFVDIESSKVHIEQTPSKNAKVTNRLRKSRIWGLLDLVGFEIYASKADQLNEEYRGIFDSVYGKCILIFSKISLYKYWYIKFLLVF